MTSRLAPLVLLLTAAATPASAAPGVTTASQVRGITIVALSALPKAPAYTGDRALCDHLLRPAETDAGRAVAALGWGVTGEGPLGPYQAVSFVGGYTAGTSGTCELTNGNVGIFAGDKLVALAYAPEGSPLSLGSIAVFGAGGLRIWDGDVLPTPVADMRVIGGTGVAVTPMATDEPVCGGAARVPFIYGLPIGMGRDLLAEAGWQPADQTASGSQSPGQAQDLAAAGLDEVEDCSGTGFAFCRFDYAGPTGALSVTTAGEMTEDGDLPFVVGYGATCHGAP